MSSMKKRKQHVPKEEAVVISSTSSTNRLGENLGPFPTDLMVEILSRLPAKSTHRFRCVSNDWVSILRSPSFADVFLTVSYARPRLLFTFQTEGKWSFFSSLQSLISDKSSSSPVVVDNDMHVPRDYSSGICRPVCGLFCTKDERYGSRMVICNPSTGLYKPLPKVRTRRRRIITYMGYDPIQQTFKVLCMTISEKPFFHKAEEHQVLTLGTGNMKWRMIECSVSHYPQENEICINGVLYYLAEDNYSRRVCMIVCFDVRSEKFNFVINEALNDIISRSTLINYKGKLAVVHHNLFGYMDGRATSFELWVMEDIEEHKWSKHIHILPPLWKTLVAETQVYVVGIIDKGESGDIVFSPCVLSSNPFYIFYYNMERNSITRIEIQGIGPLKGQNIYTFVNHVENVKHIM